MNPNQGKQLTQEALNKEFTIKFTRAELTAIFNVLHNTEYSLPNARVILPIVEKIKGPVTALSNQDYADAEITPTPVITGEEKLN